MLSISLDTMKTWARGLVISGAVALVVGCDQFPVKSANREAAAASSEVVVIDQTDNHLLVMIPKTDCEIRVWYNYQVVAIPVINNRWIENEMSLKERAERAYRLRHNARVNARFMMSSPIEMKALQARDMLKYGNPDGPSFEYLVEKSVNSGMTKQQAYEKIITSSARTDDTYNDMCD